MPQVQILSLNQFLLLAAFVLLASAFSSKILYRFGIPTLLIFLSIGMFFGADGPGNIQFNDATLARNISILGLIMIMFTGGFDTNWSTARPVAAKALLLSTLGVVITAGLVGVFVHAITNLSLIEGFLLGSVISSTDAASVFSILRSKKLNLKDRLAPMLEIESGSNDPFAYMLTLLTLSVILSSGDGASSPVLMLLRQVAFGVLIGAALGKAGAWSLRKIQLDIDGLYPILTFGFVIATYAASESIGGNGFLSVYLMGLIVGNSPIVHKISLVRFFDGISWLMQIVLFFTLGLLVNPSTFPQVALVGLAVAVFLILVARPIAVAAILTPFGYSLRHQAFVSWAGLRGAASIVFATYPLSLGLPSANLIFHTVFFVAMLSVLIQGSFMSQMAVKLDLIAPNDSVLKTFTDYAGEIHNKILELPITADSPFANKAIMDLGIPMSILIVMVKRGENVITPRGYTVVQPGDVLMLTGDSEEELLNCCTGQPSDIVV
ncbi:potassium/proton antiporter [Acidaminobacter hydrogenoformans]|uniref:Potassium/proton antiporter, CPA1 family n=1 Tax=Acidaminobacter hydrogenoformans DSM 2784 TaxID=1120920 RepID=A0A1G5RY96_9FIRM|nr:potassium/proton antiporter [Acidaminobacter hydrogenoformans]SCZ79033.1 potassium/proton antiporter, CPA1 family [Acidaminobacter hydrogenoformans DSM 2784]